MRLQVELLIRAHRSLSRVDRPRDSQDSAVHGTFREHRNPLESLTESGPPGAIARGTARNPLKLNGFSRSGGENRPPGRDPGQLGRRGRGRGPPARPRSGARAWASSAGRHEGARAASSAGRHEGRQLGRRGAAFSSAGGEGVGPPSARPGARAWGRADVRTPPAGGRGRGADMKTPPGRGRGGVGFNGGRFFGLTLQTALAGPDR